MRQLDLQSALATARALRENVENQLRAIENFAGEQIFQIASLRGREFVVKNDRGDVSILERFLDQLRFAAADVIGRCRLLQFLRDGIDHFRSSRAGELAQLFHRIAQIPFRNSILFQSDEERALLFFLW